jgi:hypothetical protein
MKAKLQTAHLENVSGSSSEVHLPSLVVSTQFPEINYTIGPALS